MPAALGVAIVALRRGPRLRWLLNALEDSPAAAELEIVVAYRSDAPDAVRALAGHPLCAGGRVRMVACAPGDSRGALRNAAWRAGSAPLVAFLDDGLRPETTWAQAALSAHARQPDAVLQGPVDPDPLEFATWHTAPWPRTRTVVPARVWPSACNVAYPRSLLERVGGFAEDLAIGEGAELACRVHRDGCPVIAVWPMRAWSAVDELGLSVSRRELAELAGLPALVARAPELRAELWLNFWWRADHPALIAGMVALALARRRPTVATALALPWTALSLTRRRASPRGVARAATEMPGLAMRAIAEIAVLTLASLRNRTAVL